MISTFRFIGQLVKQRKILHYLILHDFKSEHLGSYLGIAWAFANPLINTLLMWFVFSFGFKSQPVKDAPFMVWLICGLFPWQFISQSIINGTNAVVGQSYLVKKIVFQVEFLPLIKISSALILHVFFIVLITFFMLFYRMNFSLHILQIPYFILANTILLLGITWLTSAVTVFIRDLGMIVSISIQLLFWGTPIFWSLQILPENFRFWIKLNPFYYIINGYRSSFITHEWFWQDPYGAAYFWGFTVLIFTIGASVFRKLRPHFADVL